jgi:hypothetical protein
MTQMADYLLLIFEDEGAHARQSPQAMAELFDARARFAESLRGRGQLEDMACLRPSKDGKRVRRRSDGLQVACGPFAEGGKALGAYYWVRATSSDQAAEIARECPKLSSDEIDVRPLMKGQGDLGNGAKPGKVFAFVVLGEWATGEQWVAVMDRIDSETSGGFPADSFVKGVRLQPPNAARQGGSGGERHATVDGPYLECKEVIGGVFVMRMTGLDEAVRWASETRFVVHGSLEIRELWRS